MRGSGTPTMAWRNLWRNKRRTAITLSSIAFGILLATLFTGLGDATYGDMIDRAAVTGNGHVTLQHPEYLEAPALKRSILGTDALIAKARTRSAVTNAVARINGQVMLATARESSGAFFVGYDPAVDMVETLAVLDAIDEGTGFDAADARGIILGRRLAKFLDVRMGKKVIYTLTDKSGEIVSGVARVSGIITTNSPTIDRGLCLLPVDTLRQVLGYDKNEATQVAIFIDDQRDSGAIAAELDKEVGAGTVALPWSDTQPELAGFISMKVSSTVFLEFIIALLVAAGIFNTIFVNVMERTREFGIMMAVGFSPRNLFSLVMWESLWLGLVGIVVGIAVVAGPYYYLSTTGLDMTSMMGQGTEVAGVAFEPVMRVAIYLENAVLIALAVVTATLLAGLYPAWRAARVVPVESIKLV